MFRDLVLARIIEPVSKVGSLRVLEEAGLADPSYATLKRRLPVYAKQAWRHKLSADCAAHAGLGPASLAARPVRLPQGRPRPPTPPPGNSPHSASHAKPTTAPTCAGCCCTSSTRQHCTSATATPPVLLDGTVGE
jgi:hypothetical protein